MLLINASERQQTMSGNGKKLRDHTYGNGRRGSQSNGRSTNSPVKVLAASDRTPEGDETREPEDLDLGQGSWVSEAISSCGAGEGRDTETPRSSQLRCSDCATLVHELSNRMTTVLLNAQLLEWKLPPYSRLKRPVLEVERNAQRGGELLKQLRHQFGESASRSGTAARPVQSRAGALTVVTAQEPSVSTAANLPRHLAAVAAAPGFPPGPAELTLNCDPCTSGFFPKGDDGNER
jgi:hypothetical protein